MKKIIISLLLLIISMVLIYTYVNKESTQITYDISSPEAVVKSYFLALNNKDAKFIKATLTDKDSHVRTKTSDLVNAELIDLQEFNHLNGKITFKIKYKLQLKKGKDMFGENGVNDKFITLIRDCQNDKWIIRSIGEG